MPTSSGFGITRRPATTSSTISSRPAPRRTPRPRRRPTRRCNVHLVAPPVVWLTGLSGAGKTTIAQGVCRELERHGIEFELLDGDLIRSVFPATGFTREERDTH